MWKVFNLVFFILITSGYSESSEEQMEIFQNNILNAISKLSGKIDKVEKKVEKVEKIMVNIEGQINSIESDAYAANGKIDQLIMPEIRKVMKEVQVLKNKISIDMKVTEHSMMNNLDGINITINSLEKEVKMLFENENVSEIERENKLVDNIMNMTNNIGSVRSMIEDMSINQSNIASQQESRIIISENKIINMVNNFTNDKLEDLSKYYLEIATQQENEGVSINSSISSMENTCMSIYTNLTTMFQNVTDEITELGVDSTATGKEIVIVNDGIKIIKSNISELDSLITKALIDIEDNIIDLNSTIVENSRKQSPRNCDNIFLRGIRTTTPVQIYPYSWRPCESVSVICDQVTDQGGWLLIQQRKVVDPREDFYRPWGDYEQGFGNLNGEFWIGLKLIHELTQQAPQELYITLEDWDGSKKWVKYSHFSVGPAEDNYRLSVNGYTGNAGDNMAYHNGQAFTTHDRDNDVWSDNCAVMRKGAWWYKSCTASNLNGEPGKASGSEGIYWSRIMKSTTMKIRPTPAI